MIITFGCQKGGVGKSSLAISTAVRLVESHSKVLLVEANNEQGSSVIWGGIRDLEIAEGATMPMVQVAEMSGDIARRLRNFDTTYDYIVVDCGGYDAVEWRSAMNVSHVVVHPYRPSYMELATLPGTITRALDAQLVNPNLRSFVQLTDCNTNDKDIRANAALEEFNEWGSEDDYTLQYSPHLIHSRVAWKECYPAGRGISETNDEKATDEFDRFFNYLMNEALDDDNRHKSNNQNQA